MEHKITSQGLSIKSRLRMENKKKKIIEKRDTPLCIREINENLKRVFNNQALTRPLATLNRNCEFKKRYKIAFDLKYENKIDKEVKQRLKEYNKRYNQKLRSKTKK